MFKILLWVRINPKNSFYGILFLVYNCYTQELRYSCIGTRNYACFYTYSSVIMGAFCLICPSLKGRKRNADNFLRNFFELKIFSDDN